MLLTFDILGSGDSTIPSPLPNDRRQLHHPPHLRDQPPTTPPTPDYDQNQHPLPIPNPHSKIHGKHDNLDPPSPDALTERLRSISPRGSQLSPFRPSTPSELLSEPKIDEETNDGSRAAVISLLRPLEELNATSSPRSHLGDGRHHEKEVALRESIRSVYRLWKMSARTETDEDDREVFLRIAKEVVGLP
jgi:hypothetical protein